jgi:hypothetical protein
MNRIMRWVVSGTLAAVLTAGLYGCAHRTEYRHTEVREEIHEGPVQDAAPGEMIVE